MFTTVEAAARPPRSDKLARLRSLRRSGRSVPDEKLEHYIASLITVAKLDDPAPWPIHPASKSALPRQRGPTRAISRPRGRS
jgi:hypothetical protein